MMFIVRKIVKCTLKTLQHFKRVFDHFVDIQHHRVKKYLGIILSHFSLLISSSSLNDKYTRVNPIDNVTKLLFTLSISAMLWSFKMLVPARKTPTKIYVLNKRTRSMH